MTLPQETISRIEREAEHYANVQIGEKAKHVGHRLSHRWDDAKDDYEAGATEWAGKAQPVIDALDELLDLLPYGNLLNHYFAKEQVIKAREELAKYKEVGNG